MRAHEAGALHGETAARGPAWLRAPDDVNALLPHPVAAHRRRGTDGALTRRRHRRARPGEPSSARRPTSSTRPTSAARCRDFRDAFAGADVLLRGARRSAPRRSSAVVAEEGLGLDVCTGGELAVALRGRHAAASGSRCTATTSPMAELRRALDAGVGRIVVDSFDEIDRLTALARERGVRPTRAWSG